MNKRFLRAFALPAVLGAMTLPLSAIASESLTQRIALTGVIEVEAAYADSTDWGDSESISDIVLATAELGIEATVTENVSIQFVTLYKEGDIDFSLHTGFIQFDDIDGRGTTVSLGKMYLPFAQLQTNLVNDSLALELVSPAESLGFRESAGLVSWTMGKIGFAAYVFNGDADSDDDLSDFGISFDYTMENASVGFDYLSNVSDSAMIVDALGSNPDGELSAYSLHATAQMGNASLIIEYVKTDDLDEIGFASRKSPSVAQIDLGWDLGNGWALGLAYQSTEDAAILGLPETRTALGLGTSIYNDTVAVSVEYWHDEDHSISDGGSGDDMNALVIQIASGF